MLALVGGDKKMTKRAGVEQSKDARIEPRFETAIVASAIARGAANDGQMIVLSNISFGGFRSTKSGLTLGEVVVVHIPLIGQRRAQVRWIEGGRAGCRFAEPLTLTELRNVLGSVEIDARYFPAEVTK